MTTIAPEASAFRAERRPAWVAVLAGYSLLLGVVTAIPQLYYVLFALGVVEIGPHGNPLGQVRFWYILNGDNSCHHVDPGILAGAIEDVFLLGRSTSPRASGCGCAGPG